MQIEPSRLTLTLNNFSLAQIADSGQCFRMKPLPVENIRKIFPDSPDATGFRLISKGHVAQAYQDKNILTILSSPGDEDFWKKYLDTDTDYGALVASADPEDAYLCAAAAYGRGIRILFQDPWEMTITFIISQQKTIPKICEAVELLSQNYGDRLLDFDGNPCWAFPSPIQLSRASLEDLNRLKLGYRGKYIYRTCQDAVSGRLDLEYLHRCDYSQAMNYLMQFYGIGEKVANCICLFGLHHIEAFPVDTWIKKILDREYMDGDLKSIPKSHIYTAIVQKHFSRYEGYAGLMQQYIFYYERHLSLKGV